MTGEPSGAALWALCLGLGILPVLCYLLALVVLDSYKLVRLRWVVAAVAAGVLVALACLAIHPALLRWTGATPAAYSGLQAPAIEEALKGLVIFAAIWRRRVGFLVDAAILGFAVGAGFAATENLYYFLALDSPRILLWTLRGFGAAIMHGGATALLAVVTKALTDRADSPAPHLVLPGFLLAAGVHSVFNHLTTTPILSTTGLLVALPVVFTLVFRLSEAATHEWLGTGFDSDQELLETINGGRILETRVGGYLEGLKHRFPPDKVADMLCLIRLQLELSIRAKGVLLMRKAGFTPPPDPEVEERFSELRYLRKSIGKTGYRALQPIFSMSGRDLWQFHALGRM
ncbi:MAG: PrsW family glutamic-type intramembrane protease [Thermoanaerobaculia bacterium]|nr:PrsW family glutamic-type intramembrane protease [Thermoanaerobaculia bacterium]